MLNLPDEIILKILMLLNLFDLKSVRITCKRLYNLSLDNSVAKREILKIDDRIFRKNASDIVNALISSERVFQNLSLKNNLPVSSRISSHYNYECNPNVKAFILSLIKKFGVNLKHISIKNCNGVFCDCFQNIIEECTNIEVLDIFNSNDLFLRPLCISHQNIQLPRLSTLYLSRATHFTDEILCNFFKIAPNIENISLEDVQLNSPSSLYYKFYKDSNPLLKPSNQILTINCFKALVEIRCKTIKRINLSGNRICAPSLKQIYSIPDLQLLNISLSSCREISWDSIYNDIDFFKHSHMTEINLSGCRFTNNMLLNVCKVFVHLERMNISRCKSIDNMGLANLKCLTKLKHLNISDCLCTGDVILSNIYREENKLTPLKQLIAQNIPIKSEHMQNCIHYFDLDELIIGDYQCTRNLCDIGLQEIFYHETNLKKIALCDLAITDYGMVGYHPISPVNDIENFFQSFSPAKMKTYNLNDNMLEFKKLFKIENNICDRSISHARYLREIDLSNCLNLTDDMFKYSFDLPNLVKLDLKKTKITTRGIGFLIQKCPLIQYLDLTYTSIDDNAVCLISQGLKRLKFLTIMGCLKITNISLELILTHCKSLQYLDVRFCVSLNSVLVNDILEMPNMIQVKRLYNQLQFSAESFAIPAAPPLPDNL